MRVNFKVYPRKIDIFYLTSIKSDTTLSAGNSALYWQYLYSSYAFKTCKAAMLTAKVANPLREYKANFSK